MSYVRTAAYFFAFISSTLALYPFGIFIYAWCRLIRRYDVGETYRVIIFVYGKLWVFITRFFVKFKTDFSRTPRESFPAIIVANHQSFFDMYCFGAFVTHNVVAIVKGWVFKVLLFGFIMRNAGYLNIDDESIDYEEALTTLSTKNISLLIFPEGSRSDTKKMGRFHSGAFLLSIRTGLPILPVCIDGTFDFFPRHRKSIGKATINMTSLEPVFPKDFAIYGDSAHLKMKDHVKKVIANQLTINE